MPPAALVLANLGTLRTEFAGVAAGGELLGGVPRGVSVPVAAVAVSALVVRGSLHRVEHVLLVLSAVFATYVVAAAIVPLSTAPSHNTTSSRAF